MVREIGLSRNACRSRRVADGFMRAFWFGSCRANLIPGLLTESWI
jgi:hypothetical protein